MTYQSDADLQQRREMMILDTVEAERDGGSSCVFAEVVFRAFFGKKYPRMNTCVSP